MKKTLFTLLLLPLVTYAQVGIGTTSPQEQLHVAGTGSTVRIDGLSSAGAVSGTAVKSVSVDVNGNLITTNTPQIASFQGVVIPVCNSVSVGSTGSFSTPIDGVSTTVSWEVLVQNTSTGTTTNTGNGGNPNYVLNAPYNAERLQARYDFSPALPFAPKSIIFTGNNTSSHPDTFSINYAAKSINSITVNITRTDKLGDDGVIFGSGHKCWMGDFFFDVLITN